MEFFKVKWGHVPTLTPMLVRHCSYCMVVDPIIYIFLLKWCHAVSFLWPWVQGHFFNGRGNDTTTNSITKRPTRDKGQEKKMNWCMVRQIYCAKSKTWKLRENKEGISVHKRNKERRVNCGSSRPLQFFSPLIGSI